MKLTFVLIIAAILQASASGYAQITFSQNRVPLEKVFEAIKSQTGYRILYSPQILDKSNLVDISVKDATLSTVLEKCFEGQPITYSIKNKTVIVREKAASKEQQTQEVVKGKVVDKAGIPLIGVYVKLKGSSLGTITGLEGDYSLNIPEITPTSTLVFSYIGFTTQEIQVGNERTINITLQQAISGLNEVVVVGYGSLNKRNLTGSIAKINDGLIADLPDVSFQNRLAGKLAGVNISQTTGAPGGNVSIRIRGTGSITAGNDPLIVIDGFPISDRQNTATVQGSRPASDTRQENPQNSLSTLNPNDIQSVEVLKDAAAAAIYGSRGSNGVILITTKKGIEGKPTFSFNAFSGLQSVTKTYDMMDAYEFAEQNYISRANGGTLSGFRADWLPYLNDEPGLVNTDWQDALYRTALMQNYDMSVRGGNKQTKYYISGNFADQDGIVLGSGYKRYGLRANLDAELSKNLRIGINASPSLTLSDLVPTDNPYFVDGVVNLALLSLPTESIYNPDGSFNFRQNSLSGSGPFVNPVAIATLLDDKLKQTRLLLGTYLEIDILKDFKFRTQLGADFNNWNRAYYRPSTIEYRGVPGPSNPEARNFSTQGYNWISENTLTYDKKFKEKHNLNVLVGYTAQKDLLDRNGIYANNFPNDFVQTLNAGQITSAFSAKSEWSLLSYLSRVTYDYDGKYLITASIRRDGASRFGKNTKYGYFPSVSAGWRISDEKFFNIEYINDLKLRASYGKTGNFSISNYGAIALLESANYIFNDTRVNGIAPSTSPNADLSWEKNSSYNFGLDLGLFKDKLVFNADYFISTTKDLLINLPVPGSSGFSNSLQNIGEIENKGFELGVTNNLVVGDFKIATSANISTIKNKVLSTGRNNEPIIANGGVESTHITKVGEPLGSYFGYNVLGVFTTQEQLNTNPHQANAALGDFIFEDINKDGAINSNDRTIIGSYFPDYTYGLTTQIAYKNIDFSIGIQGKQGFEVLHLAQRYLGSLQTFSNYRADVFRDAYISSERPGNGMVYRPNSSPTNQNDAISTYHVEDGSYIRVQNITLGYSLKAGMLKRLGNLQRIRIYATAANPFTFTKYPGYNPDVDQRPNSALTQGEDYGTYPLAKNFIFGVNVSF